MMWRLWVGQWLMASARRHEIKASRLKARAEKFFKAIKGVK